MAERILVLAAHNDDSIIGAGGTLAKYASEGKYVKTVIFSYGEFSHPHLKRDVIAKRRVDEAIESEKILGGSGLIFVGLKDTKYLQDMQSQRIREMVSNIIKKERPHKIFTHSSDDPHIQHRAVHRLVKELNPNCEIYSFDIWNIVNFRNRNRPKLVVDISSTFATKIMALKTHKSQTLTILSLLWKIYLRDITNGLNHNCKYCEVFFKLK